MKIVHIIAANVLVLAFPICTAKALPAPQSDSDPEGLYSSKVGKSPAEIIRHYQQYAPTTSADLFTLALAYYARADFQRALDLANRALALQSDPVARSVCFALIAESHGALGQYELAAESALQGLRLDPKSTGLAASRYAYTTLANDKLGAMAAKEHLMQLDPSFEKHPTFDPITIGVIILGIICLTHIVVELIASGTKNPEVAKEIAGSTGRLLRDGKVAELLVPFTADKAL